MFHYTRVPTITFHGYTGRHRKTVPLAKARFYIHKKGQGNCSKGENLKGSPTFNSTDDIGVQLLVLVLALGREGGASQGLPVPECVHQFVGQLCSVLGLSASLLQLREGHVDPCTRNELHTLTTLPVHTAVQGRKMSSKFLCR